MGTPEYFACGLRGWIVGLTRVNKQEMSAFDADAKYL